jgi:hypothetical protein
MKISVKGDAQQRTMEKILKDSMVNNLMTKSIEEIIDWWDNTATPAQKDAMTLRLMLLVSGLMRGKFN